MLKGSYQYKNGTWTLFATGANHWTPTETAQAFLTRLGFNTNEAYARDESVGIKNHMFKVMIFETMEPSISGFVACVYIALRDYEDRGAMALVDEINELIALLSLIQPILEVPIQRKATPDIKMALKGSEK